ncbi:MAG: O-antigen ligase family protein [Clostridia bacterium]|nr:O-antigen ligase family protein [Clostridia bacterium]
MSGNRSLVRQICEHVYMLSVCVFLLWDVAYMTEGSFTAVSAYFPAVWYGLAAAALVMCRGRLGPVWLLMALLLWMTASSAYRGTQVLEAEQQALANGVLAFLVICPAPRVIAPRRLEGYLRTLLALWTAAFTLQAAIGLWAALTGHAVFSLKGTWYIGVNMGDNRLYLMAYVTTSAVKLGLSVLLAALGAVMHRRAGRVMYILCALVQLVCLSLTDCRTAFIAVGAALGAMALIALVRRGKGKVRPCLMLRWACGLLAVLVLTVGMYVGLTRTLTALSPHVDHELNNLTILELPAELLPAASAEDTGAVRHRALEAGNLLNDRTLIWKAALRLLVFSPKYLVTGTTTALSPILMNAYLLEIVERPFNHAHNIYLQTLVSWGIPGFALLAAFLVIFLRAAWRVAFVHAVPSWQRFVPVPVLYVMLCEMVDCFTLLSAATPMLLLGCFFAGLTLAIDAREVRR